MPRMAENRISKVEKSGRSITRWENQEGVNHTDGQGQENVTADLDEQHQNQLTFGATLSRDQDSSLGMLLTVANGQQSKDGHEKRSDDRKENALDRAVDLFVHCRCVVLTAVPRLEIDDDRRIGIQKGKENNHPADRPCGDASAAQPTETNVRGTGAKAIDRSQNDEVGGHRNAQLGKIR